MKSNLTDNIALNIERFIEARRELVWKAWSEPAVVEKWLRMGMAIESVKMDFRVGGKFRVQIKMSDKEFFTMAGIYMEIKPPERIVYTLDWEKDGSGTEFGELEGNESLVTVEFRAFPEGTKLALTHERFASVESRDRHQEGWRMWMDLLSEFLEGKTP